MFLATILKRTLNIIKYILWERFAFNSLLKGLFPIRKIKGIFFISPVTQNTMKQMPPDFHRQIRDVSVAIYLLNVAIHSSILDTCPFAMTAMLLPWRDRVCFSTPWIRAWPYYLLWPTGNLHMWCTQRPGKHSCTGAHVLLLSLVTWQCHGKKLD